MRRATKCAPVVIAVGSIPVISYPSLCNTIGRNPNPQTLNRAIKGDRLPMRAISRAPHLPSISRAQKILGDA
jgi:hypothetical protein